MIYNGRPISNGLEGHLQFFFTHFILSTSILPQYQAHLAPLKHRLICMIYEAVLLFGVFFSADLAFDIIAPMLIKNTNDIAFRHWRQAYLFVVIGTYFIHFWRHGGQTLPMQTWHLKLVSIDNKTPTFKQACLRYCAAWMWFVPALSVNYLFEIKQWPAIAVLVTGMTAWGLTARLDKNGQFLHDKLAGTQLISVPKKPRIADTE